MNDEKWIEQVCRAVCRNKGVDPEKWESERPVVNQVITAIRETDAVIVPIVGEVE